MKYSLLVIPALFLLSACGGVGSSGKYKEIPGKITITEIKNIINARCSDSVQVYYDFIPDDPNAVKNYLFPNFSDTHNELYNNYDAPSRSWTIRKNINIGNTYPATRYEILPGTGTSAPFGISVKDENILPYHQQNPDGTVEDICK